MANLTGAKMTPRGIGELIKDNRLRVPIYQRAYSWKAEHVEDLLNDFARAVNQQEGDYFVGSVVATKAGKEPPEIVDGQQRLATCCMIIATIRDIFLELGDEEGAKIIQETYIRSVDIKTRLMEEHMRLSRHDHNFFLNTVLLLPVDRKEKLTARITSHRRIENAAKQISVFFHKLISAYSAAADQKDVLYRWIEFLVSHAHVIWITVPDQADAFVIFETLNDRGLELSTSDLLKNYLFGKAGKDRLGEVETQWNKMLGILESVSTTDMATNFIHQLWSSQQGVTRKRELFKDISDKIVTPQDSVTFANELVDNAQLYAALRNSQHEYWNKYGGTAREHIRVLNENLGVWQIRTLLLATLAKFSVEDVKKVMPLAVSWSVRYLVSGGSPGNLETYYAQHAVKIRKGEIKNSKELAKAIGSVMPSDELFEAAFSKEVANEQLSRYYLRCLENVLSNSPTPHLVASDNTAVASLEHILPERPDAKYWSHVSGEDHARIYRRLGNLTLLAEEANTKRENGSFDTAKTIYETSGFEITKQIATHEGVWDQAAIDARQAALAKLAARTWPITLK